MPPKQQKPELPVQEAAQPVSALPVVNQEETAPVRSARIVSLEDLGYKTELHLPGAYPEFTFHLLNYEGLTKAVMEVPLRFSSVLSEKSAVTVEIDDIPLFTKSMKEVGTTPLLSIPINPSKGDFTKIAIKGHLLITDDACEDVSTGNLWMVVSNKARLMLEGDGKIPKNIASFFKNYENDFNIAFDTDKVSFEALPLFYYIHQLNDWKDVHLSINDKQPTDKKTIRVGRFSQDIETQKGELLVYEKGIHLLKKSLMDLYITPALKLIPNGVLGKCFSHFIWAST